MEHKLSEKWIKASIAGTIWAASEIVLGSFLHNLKVPFSGNILTAIGIIILISISYIWTDRGLFWRAGLICAVLKTMSPSAVIFGPMIAIIAESLLLELSVTMFGRTLAGYLIGSMLAMLWNLIQKVMNFIIFYGSNIIEVYTNLLKYAQKQLDIQTDIVWVPIIILFIVYALFGITAGIIGIKTGRKMQSQPASVLTALRSGPVSQVSSSTGHTFKYSVVWLFINVLLIIGSFILLNKTPWFIWSSLISVVIIIWSVRYKRALKQLSKPGFWIFFVIITLITAFALTDTAAGESLIDKGLLTGIQMNFRAVVIILGFSVLGTELYNPVVRNFFLKTSFRNLPLAIELSVESLPGFIASIPDFKSLVRNPVSIFYQVISHAEKRFSEIKNKGADNQRVFILTASIGEGKTTYAKKLIDLFRNKGTSVGGVISERVMMNSQTTGYDLVNIETGESAILLRHDGKCGSERIGRYTICKGGIERGNEILRSLASRKIQLIIIDEVGLLELQDKGWTESINQLMAESSVNLLITVRTDYVDAVIKKWDIRNAVTFDVRKTEYTDTAISILNNMSIGNHE